MENFLEMEERLFSITLRNKIQRFLLSKNGKLECNKGTASMRKIEELKVIIANEFASAYKAYDLKVVCQKYGILPDEGLDPMNSKRIYVGNGLNKMQDDDIWKLARLIVKEFESKELIKEI